MNIGILGPGAIGGLLASQLINLDNRIFCFGTEQSNFLIRENGINVKSNFYGNKRFFPETVLDSQEVMNYLFLTVKGYNLIVLF